MGLLPSTGPCFHLSVSLASATGSPCCYSSTPTIFCALGSGCDGKMAEGGSRSSPRRGSFEGISSLFPRHPLSALLLQLRSEDSDCWICSSHKLVSIPALGLLKGSPKPWNFFWGEGKQGRRLLPPLPWLFSCSRSFYLPVKKEAAKNGKRSHVEGSLSSGPRYGEVQFGLFTLTPAPGPAAACGSLHGTPHQQAAVALLDDSTAMYNANRVCGKYWVGSDSLVSIFSPPLPSPALVPGESCNSSSLLWWLFFRTGVRRPHSWMHPLQTQPLSSCPTRPQALDTRFLSDVWSSVILQVLCTYIPDWLLSSHFTPAL